MKYFFLVACRFFLTVLCRIFASLAEKTKFSWAISIMDFFLKRHGYSVGKEAVYNMNMIRKWQIRAKKCVLAHHEFEKFMTLGERK